MKFDTTRQFQLRSGARASIRIATARDIPGMFELNRAIIEDGQGAVSTVEDLPDLDMFREHTARDLDKHDGGSKGAVLVAMDRAARVIAEGVIWRAGPSLCSHVTQMSLQVHPDAQGEGLGRAVSESLLAWARGAHPEVSRVGLHARADNARALALYESLGFEREGVRRRSVRLADGAYVDDVTMGLLL